MKLAASNIAWGPGQDPIMYMTLAELGYKGLEIAPTRLFPDEPYERLSDASGFASQLMSEHGLAVCSMQSIWFGRKHRIFGSAEEREELVCYTIKALGFAKAIGCTNLVFGNPKNRNLECHEAAGAGIGFFRRIGDLAHEAGAVIAMEPNPVIYGTNFLNTTAETAKYVREIGSAGLRMNLDFGTLLYNGEGLSVVEENLDIINHVHISEPNLAVIAESPRHLDLACMLRENGYGGFVSLEMRKQDCEEDLSDALAYIKEVFGDEEGGSER